MELAAVLGGLVRMAMERCSPTNQLSPGCPGSIRPGLRVIPAPLFAKCRQRRPSGARPTPRRGQSDHDAKAVQELLAHPPVLSDRDPRALLATDRTLTRSGGFVLPEAGARATIRTHADYYDVANRFPVI